MISLRSSGLRASRPGTRLRFAFVALAAVLFVAAGRPAAAQDADPVVAKVDGTDIRASDVALVEEELGASIPAMAPEARRDYLISLIADTILVAKAAEAKGIADAPDFKRRLAFARNRQLHAVNEQIQRRAQRPDDRHRLTHADVGTGANRRRIVLA